jgi:hypothetical protein
VASARSEVGRLVATKQLADRRTMVALTVANALQSPNSIDVIA